LVGLRQLTQMPGDLYGHANIALQWPDSRGYKA